MGQYNNYLIAWKKKSCYSFAFSQGKTIRLNRETRRKGPLYRICHLQGWVHQAKDFFIITWLQTNYVINHVIHLQQKRWTKKNKIVIETTRIQKPDKALQPHAVSLEHGRSRGAGAVPNPPPGPWLPLVSQDSQVMTKLRLHGLTHSSHQQLPCITCPRTHCSSQERRSRQLPIEPPTLRMWISLPRAALPAHPLAHSSTFGIKTCAQTVMPKPLTPVGEGEGTKACCWVRGCPPSTTESVGFTSLIHSPRKHHPRAAQRWL